MGINLDPDFLQVGINLDPNLVQTTTLFLMCDIWSPYFSFHGIPVGINTRRK